MSPKISTSSRFDATYGYFLCRFGVRLLAKNQQRSNSKSVGFVRNICRLWIENGSNLTAKSWKCPNFCQFLSVKTTPIGTPEAQQPLFPQQESQKILFEFFGKVLRWRK